MGSVGVISRRTWVVVGGGLAVSAGFLVLIRLGAGGSGSGGAFVGSMPSLLTGVLASAIAIWAALSFDRGEALRRQWLLIGIGMTLILIGDAAYAYLEVIAQEVLFPSVADVFYLLSFVFFAGGVVQALFGFRNSLDLRKPMLFAFGACVLVTAALWTGVFQPVLGDPEASGLEKVLSVLYPVGDIWLLVFPAAALAVALSPLGQGRLAWPWWALAVAFALIAVSDTAFTLLESSDMYVT
ncbi:MAG: hypothetical protein U1E29_03880, partial [Coriobacteriia bacterium]|nr:hypothetical protein [Coriobacteriia bacterium]